eukprot:scaffold1298_cov257-Pinguiococcus_pyrenoidosus.AAC.5
MNDDSALMTRSGRRQRTTSIFWKGVRSRAAQSSGSFSLSGVIMLNHSRKRGAASTRSTQNLPNSSISPSAWQAFQYSLGSQSSGLASPSFFGPRSRNWKKNPPLHEAEENLPAEDELVALEEPPTHPGVDSESKRLAQVLHALGLLLRRHRALDALVEERDEAVQAVLVHVVDAAEFGQQEVQHGALGRLRSVVLASGIQGHLGLLVGRHGGVDLDGRLLGGLQPLDERHVAEDVLRRVGQPLEQVVLQAQQLHLVLLELALEVLRLLLQLRLLDAHDLREQLVLQASLGGDEVDEGALRRDLRLVVRVAQLRLQVQAKRRVVFHFLAADVDVQLLAFLVDGAAEHRVERGVDLFSQVLDDDDLPVGQRTEDLA